MWKLQLVGRRLWLWIVYLAVVVALVLVHYRSEIFEADCGSLSWTAKLWHQRLCRAGHREPRTHYVSLVTLTSGREPIEDKCQGRRFMASLLLRLRDMDPGLIAIDKWYLPGGCNDAGATAALQQAINDVSQKVPIVVAQSSDTYHELRANNDPDLALWKKLGLPEGAQVLSESAITDDGKRSQLALARLACNNWQIPLKISVYPPLHKMDGTSQPSPTPTPKDALALAVAKKRDPRITNKMNEHFNNDDSLVGAFLEIKQFENFSATQILCGRQASAYNEAQCKAAPLLGIDLRGRIVLIGQYSNTDTHETVMGPMPGFLLQANYIESLLDDRFYRMMGKWWEVLLAIVCLVLVDITIEAKHHRGAVYSLAGLVFLWGLAHLSILEWGYYFTFWFPAAIGVAAKWLETSVKMPKPKPAGRAAAGG